MQVSRVFIGVHEEPSPEARQAVPTEGKSVFAFWLATYLVAGSLLVFRGNVILGDALARVENIDRVLYSRDPHLAAIGFNFPPLPQLLYLPFIPLASLWPALVKYGFIGNIFSAFFMAAAVYQLRGFMADIGVRRGPRLALIATFALHPMVLYSGANGMTEAPSLLFLMLAVRQLARWLRWGSVSAQVYTGVALSLAFLTRYEAVWAGIGVMALATLVTASRRRGGGRIVTGLCDAIVFGGPLMFTVVGWIATNWLITGSPFAEITNAYGTAQLHIAGTEAVDARLWTQGLLGIVTMEPLLPVIAVVAAVVGWRRRDLAFAAVVAIFVPVLAFMYWGWATQNLLPSLRYLIVCVPLATLLAGVALASKDEAVLRVVRPAHARSRDRVPDSRSSARMAAKAAPVVILTAMLAIAAPIGAAGAWAQQGSGASGLATVLPLPLPSDAAQRAAHRWTTEREVAQYLDSLSLPQGSVLMDDFEGFAIFINSDNKRQFVITSDRDFQAALAEPADAGVRYILVPQPKDIAVLEAVNRTYPGFYFNGGGIADLEKEFLQNSDGPIWRLYRVRHS